MMEYTWQMAFTVVGCFWAAVIIYSIKSDRQNKIDESIHSLDKTRLQHEGDIEWLKACYRKLIGMEK